MTGVTKTCKAFGGYHGFNQKPEEKPQFHH